MPVVYCTPADTGSSNEADSSAAKAVAVLRVRTMLQQTCAHVSNLCQQCVLRTGYFG